MLAKNHPYIQLYLAENVRKGLEAVSNGQTYASVGKDMGQRAAQLAELVENEAALIDGLKYEATVKDKFFSIIAHALKSPFDSLFGMTQMMSKLADRFSKDQLVEYATNVNEAGEQVFELLQNLLEWSRLQMEGARLDVEILPSRELAQECINISKPVALEKEIRLTNKIKNAAAFADRGMVQTVLRNLIGNSLKFTPSNGSVEITSQNHGDRIQVTVSDTDVGGEVPGPFPRRHRRGLHRRSNHGGGRPRPDQPHSGPGALPPPAAAHLPPGPGHGVGADGASSIRPCPLTSHGERTSVLFGVQWAT